MAFDLSDLLKDVPDLGTNREQIEYIVLDLIDEDPNNFYQLSGIEELAANIELCGLQQPIRVRKQEDGRYMIVSGHRRRKAVELLAQEDSQRWKEVPCIVETDTVSPALQQLRLIYANANTRVMTSAEYAKQVDEVTSLLYQLKAEGYEFPGRMRDHVAKAVGISKTKISRLNMIRENLVAIWKPYFEDNSLAEQTAYYLAQLPVDEQLRIFSFADGRYDKPSSLSAAVVERYKDRIATMKELICPTEGIPCENMEGKRSATIRCGLYDFHHCTTCCAKCSELTSCRFACPKLADQIAQQKKDTRDQKRKEKEEEAAKNAPRIEQIRDLWIRFGTLREQAGKSVKDVFDATKCWYSQAHDEPKYAKREKGLDIDLNSSLPYGTGILRHEVQALITIADLFGCTLDQLLCRTDIDVTEPDDAPNSNTGWLTGEPVNIGKYVLLLQDNECSGPRAQIWTWKGDNWYDSGFSWDEDLDGKILGWIPLPEDSYGD